MTKFIYASTFIIVLISSIIEIIQDKKPIDEIPVDTVLKSEVQFQKNQKRVGIQECQMLSQEICTEIDSCYFYKNQKP